MCSWRARFLVVKQGQIKIITDRNPGNEVFPQGFHESRNRITAAINDAKKKAGALFHPEQHTVIRDCMGYIAWCKNGIRIKKRVFF